MLTFENVSFSFRGGAGVRNLTFEISPGEIVALVGLNGAGKTTLMRLALGMIRPQQGTARIFGQPLDAVPSATWAKVGALIEVPLAYPELTVRENLRIASLLHGGGRSQRGSGRDSGFVSNRHGSQRTIDGSVVDESVETWRLAPVADRRFRRLSLGNRQRVGLAAALQHDPQLIVLDEPSNALDPASVILLRDQLVQRAKQGAAILVSSHHLDEVARIAHRVLLMNAGRLIGELEITGTDLERAFFERIRDDDERRSETLGASR